MDKHEQAVLRGEEAERLLNSEMFEAAFTDTRKALLEAWASIERSDDAYKERSKDLHRMLQCLEKVKKCLRTHIETGKLAHAEIQGRDRRRLFSLGR